MPLWYSIVIVLFYLRSYYHLFYSVNIKISTNRKTKTETTGNIFFYSSRALEMIEKGLATENKTGEYRQVRAHSSEEWVAVTARTPTTWETQRNSLLDTTACAWVGVCEEERASAAHLLAVVHSLGLDSSEAHGLEMIGAIVISLMSLLKL